MSEMSFPPIERASRPDAIRSGLAAHGCDAMLVTNLMNIRWLTGFTGSNGRVLVLPDRVVLVTDGRYRDRAADELAAAHVDVEVVVGFSLAEQHQLLVDQCFDLTSVAAESSDLSYDGWHAFSQRLPLRAMTGLIEGLRRQKDDGEIARITAGAAAADRALAEVAPQLAGMTEHEVRTELEYQMRRHGADGPSYDTIVASGPTNAARPHHEASRRMIIEGDTVIIDVGGLVDGYHSDMTRSYIIGDPTPQQGELYELVAASQQAGLNAVVAGAAARDVDAACRSVFIEAGYGDWFLHGTGHGVGLEIHEEPFENSTSTAELLGGDVVTVEPGLYRVGVGGIRIEDLVVVTDTGHRLLTHTPKETPCLPSPPTT